MVALASGWVGGQSPDIRSAATRRMKKENFLLAAIFREYQSAQPMQILLNILDLNVPSQCFFSVLSLQPILNLQVATSNEEEPCTVFCTEFGKVKRGIQDAIQICKGGGFCSRSLHILYIYTNKHTLSYTHTPTSPHPPVPISWHTHIALLWQLGVLCRLTSLDLFSKYLPEGGQQRVMNDSNCTRLSRRRMIWLPPSHPLTSASCLSFSVFLYVAGFLMVEGSARGGRGAKSYDVENAWSSTVSIIQHSLGDYNRKKKG